MNTDLYEFGVIIGESRIHMKCNRKGAIPHAIRRMRHHRQELLEYITRHPKFRYALEPMEVTEPVPRIVEKMAESARIASVGPMASVAGALADLGLESMVECGAQVAVIENGGEIAAFTDRPIPITLVSSSFAVAGKIGFWITQEDCPVGIATSSSRTNHAIGFGEADSATVIADDAALADAAATAVCNAVAGRNIEASIERGLKESGRIKGVRGTLITREGHVGLAGKLPRIIKIKE